ncbi:GT4 family glycosyltransferase PelF [Actinomyces gerencseriae]|uniref:GT4 family glycosyltransferase PelF n=1 Tax=Actinomyces gerencseriae TaxID=52769 RepID=UPI0004293555|nr:GT4 family glycosyltransferase PelF [Actinomyces gerencseriae]
MVGIASSNQGHVLRGDDHLPAVGEGGGLVLPDGVPPDGHYEDVDVAIVMESTYPYLKGGVSAVVHDIITGNPDLSFGIIHIAWSSTSPLTDLYHMPDNVAWVRVLYLSMEEHEEFLRTRPQDLRMGRRGRRALAERLVAALRSLAEDADCGPVWDLIADGMAASTRRYPLWALLGTREFMEVYRDSMPNLGMSMADLFWSLRDFFSLAYAVLSETMPRAAVYHAHTTGYAALLAANAAREHGTSYLLTEHNLYVRDTVNTLLDRRMDQTVTLTDYRFFDVTSRERMWMAWWLEMGRMCYPGAYATTYLYPAAIEEARALGGDPSKAVVIPNGIVTEEFDAAFAAQREKTRGIRAEGADSHLWRLVYIARVVPIKGLMDLIESIRILRERGLSIHLDVCGPTEHVPEYYERCCARIAELGLEDAITIRGTVKVRQCLTEFDLFLLPSYNEGLPVVSLETMGAGIPTVSTDVGAVRTVVEDEIVGPDSRVWGPCGLVIVPGDPEIMADGVERIIRDIDLYEQLSLAARGRVEAAYDLHRVNAAYNDLYRRGGAGRMGAGRGDAPVTRDAPPAVAVRPAPPLAAPSGAARPAIPATAAQPVAPPAPARPVEPARPVGGPAVRPAGGPVPPVAASAPPAAARAAARPVEPARPVGGPAVRPAGAHAAGAAPSAGTPGSTTPARPAPPAPARPVEPARPTGGPAARPAGAHAAQSAPPAAAARPVSPSDARAAGPARRGAVAQAADAVRPATGAHAARAVRGAAAPSEAQPVRRS